MNYLILFTYLSFRKLLNIVLVYLGYALSIITKKVIVLGYPYAVSIETSAICNLKCPECPTGNNSLDRKQGLMSITDFTHLINQLKEYCIYINLSLQGEPFLNSDIFTMIDYANSNRIYSSLSTNGHFLDSETTEKIISSGLQRIIISLDGASPEIYEQYRNGGSFENVVKGIKLLSEVKKGKKTATPEIVIQFIVFSHNEHQIDEIKKLGKSLGANKVILKSAQIDYHDKNDYLLPLNKKYSRYELTDKELRIKNKLKNRCFRLWETMVITWDGLIIPCCFDKDAQYPIEKSGNQSIFNVWKSLAFNNFRKNILYDRKKTAICCNCTEGLRIKY